MREAYGDLWAYPADAVCIPTNGDVNRRGLAVMGRGVARQAAVRIPGIQRDLGVLLKRDGNVVNLLRGALPGVGPVVLSFPTKHRWLDRADPTLIVRSCRQLTALADRFPEWRTIALPRPGCGNGGLSWPTVRPLLAGLLDDRFMVVERGQ